MGSGPEVSRREFLWEGARLGALALITPERVLKILSQETEPILTSSFLMYHEISYRGLKADLLNLIQKGYQPISLETLIGYFNGEIIIPKDLPTFLVTMDDGLASQYEQGLEAVEEVGRETGWFVPLTLFVMTQFEDSLLPVEEIPNTTPSYNNGQYRRYLTKGQLIEMIKLGHRVENHTVNHGNLTRLSWGARNAEVEIGEERIGDLWKLAGRKRKYRNFAYPYGVYSGQLDYISSLGYDLAFTNRGSDQHFPSRRYFLSRIRKS